MKNKQWIEEELLRTVKEFEHYLNKGDWAAYVYSIQLLGKILELDEKTIDMIRDLRVNLEYHRKDWDYVSSNIIKLFNS